MRPFLTLSLLLFVTGCGFHAQQSREYQDSLAVDLSAIRIQVYQNRYGTPMEDHSHLGQLLETNIREGVNPRLGESEKLYNLRILVTESDIPLFINPDGTSSRGNIQYTSNYTLTRIVDNKVVQSGSIQRTSSYNTTQNADYAAFVSQQDAQTRGIEELAEGYKLRLSNLLPMLNGHTAMLVPAATTSGTMPAAPKPAADYTSSYFGGPNETRPTGY